MFYFFQVCPRNNGDETRINKYAKRKFTAEEIVDDLSIGTDLFSLNGRCNMVN